MQTPRPPEAACGHRTSSENSRPTQHTVVIDDRDLVLGECDLSPEDWEMTANG